jgi:thiol-disulfide isomerase/thioredoxin
VVVLAIATVVAFTAGDGDDDVLRLDPNATDSGRDGLTGTDVTGDQLPTLTYETFAGDTVTLTPDGRPLLVNFWSSICVPCVTEMPALEQVWQANAGAIDLIGIQVAENAGRGEAMVEQTGVTYPVGRDPSGDVFQALGGAQLPRTVIIGADGTVEYVHTGALTADEVQAAVDDALGS